MRADRRLLLKQHVFRTQESEPRRDREAMTSRPERGWRVHHAQSTRRRFVPARCHVKLSDQS